MIKSRVIGKENLRICEKYQSKKCQYKKKKREHLK